MADHSLSTNRRIEELQAAVTEMKRTLFDFQRLLRQKAEAMGRVMEIIQALSEVMTGGQLNATK
jgi:hypothetical protein